LIEEEELVPQLKNRLMALPATRVNPQNLFFPTPTQSLCLRANL
jgi:hypothetical protein